jgi:ATP-dependent Lon protease
MKLIHNSEVLRIKSSLPVVPLRDVVVYPHMIYPLLIGRKLTVNALQEAMIKNKQLLLVAQRSPSVENPSPSDLYRVGVVARVLQVMKMPNGTLKVLVEGLVRAHPGRGPRFGRIDREIPPGSRYDCRPYSAEDGVEAEDP